MGAIPAIEIILSTNHLQHSYKGEKAIRFPDITCGQGEHILILGPSGVGKTTLLHLIGGILRPSIGDIQILGRSLSTMKEREMDRFRASHIGIVFQSPKFIKSLSVLENIRLAGQFIGKDPPPALAEHLLRSMGIWEKRKRKPFLLSAGEQQRAGIARALINRPEILLCDEPTSALDDEQCERVAELLLEEAGNAGSSLVIVTHDHRLKGYFDKHYILEGLP